MLKTLRLMLMPLMALSLYSATTWAADDDDDDDDKSASMQIEGLNLSDGASDGFYLTNSYCAYYPNLPECLNYVYPYTGYYGWGSWGGWSGGRGYHHHKGHHKNHHKGGGHRRR